MRLETLVDELYKIAMNPRIGAAAKGALGGSLFGGFQGALTSAVNPLMIMDIDKNGKEDYLKNIAYGGLGGAAIGGLVGGSHGAKNLGQSVNRTRLKLIGNDNGELKFIDPKGTPIYHDEVMIDHSINAQRGGNQARLLAPAIGMGMVMKDRVKKEQNKESN